MRFAKTCSVIVVISLIAVIFAGLSTPVGAMMWTGGLLDNSHNSMEGGHSSIAVDSTGAPKICYFASEGLKYTEWIHGTSTTPGHWSSPVYIDPTPGVGFYCDIALYPNGNPAVVYYDGNNQALKFALRNAQGTWQVFTIDNGGDVGQFCSIAISSDSSERICYLDAANRDLKYAEWIHGTSTTPGHWDIRTIASGDVIGACSIALDKNNNPYISYTGDRTGGGADVRLTYRIGSTSWQTQNIPGSSSGVEQTSIAVDQASGRVCISFEANGVYYVERGSTTGTWSTPTTVDAVSSADPSLALDTNNQPAISYTAEVSTGNYVLKFAYRDAAGWHKQTVDDGGSTHEYEGADNSLAIGSGNNVPSISYYEPMQGMLKYIEGHSTSTAMTCTVSASSVALNQAFTVRGKLTSNGAALSMEAVHLERRALTGSTWGAWATVASTTRITPSDGTVSTSQKMPTAGTYQYRWHYAGSIAYTATYSPVVTVTVKTSTTTTITASNKYPAVGQTVTFTVTLKSGTTGLSKPVKIWHTLNGVRYEDGTHNTVSGVYTFKQAFASKGQRIYHAEFAGGSGYPSSSGTVTVNVGTTTATITASDTTPAVGQTDTFTVTLKAGTTPLSGKPVTIYHYLKGVKYTDITKTTNTYGKITFTQTFGSTGIRTYYAKFAGDSSFASSTSSVLTITVH